MVKTSKAKKHIRYMCAKRLKQKDTDNAYNILCTFFDKHIDIINNLIEKEDAIYTHIEQISFNLSIFKNTINIIQNKLLKQNKFTFLNHFVTLDIKQSSINNFIIYYKKFIKDVSTTHCCRAKVGDNIIGFVKENKVTVHHKMCIEAEKLILNKTPSVFIQWDMANIKKYKLEIKLDDIKGSLLSMLSIVDNIGADISSIKLNNKENKNKHYCKIYFDSKVNKEIIESKLIKKGFYIKNLKLLDYKEKIY
jgi:GTP pyrophosphokinase